ncbi:MAG: putative C-S lyase [Chloroflexi bacterium HGW-Chloroflexi-10]|nr:MAG: putative C-S lyase [Chloroflexi bacterium HGW-Chloroflexi-10]
MIYDFDEVIPRRETDSVKWRAYDADVLPMWVADMDFRSPQPVLDSLNARINHGIFGYPETDPELKRVVHERLLRLYNWKVLEDDIVFLPGVVTAFNTVVHALTQPGSGVLMQTPVYPPFLTAPQNAGAVRQEAPLAVNGTLEYGIDLQAFEDAIQPDTAMFLFCNPHNPVGRVFTRKELIGLAQICLYKGIPVCSDEIHCDLIYPGYQHIPLASLNDEIAQNTITLMAPSKTYNIAGLGCSFAVVQNPELRKKLEAAHLGLVGHVNILGYTAALAAYRDGQEWLDQVLVYLKDNRDFLQEFVNQNLPGIRMTRMEGTYLAWLDCRSLDKDPYKFFLKEARVALNDGKVFGSGGEGFVRMNIGCSRVLLKEALERMASALKQR